MSCGSRLTERELGFTFLIGRHWSCDILLRHEDAPLRWIEVRWFRGSWGWRALGREGDTIGPATWLRPGWRRLDPDDRSTRLVRLRQIASIELIDASPPKVHAIDLQTGRVLLRAELGEALNRVGMGHWRTPTGHPCRTEPCW